MAHTEQHYRNAAHEMANGFLCGHFDPCARDEVGALSPLDAKAVSEINLQASAERNDVLLGTLSGNIESVHLVGAALAHSTDKRSEDKKRRNQDTQTQQLLDLIDRQRNDLEDYIKDLKERARALDGYIEALETEIAETDELIAENQQRMNEMQAEIDFYREHGEFRRDENGNLSQVVRESLAAQAKKTGKTVDSNDHAAIYVVLAADLDDRQDQHEKWTTDKRHWQDQVYGARKERGDLERDLEIAEDAVNAADNLTDPKAQSDVMGGALDHKAATLHQRKSVQDIEQKMEQQGLGGARAEKAKAQLAGFGRPPSNQPAMSEEVGNDSAASPPSVDGPGL